MKKILTILLMFTMVLSSVIMSKNIVADEPNKVEYVWGESHPNSVNLPIDYNEYSAGDEVEIKDAPKNVMGYANNEPDGNPGVWKFLGWDTSALSDGKHHPGGGTVKITGTWEFEPYEYTGLTITKEWNNVPEDERPKQIEIDLNGSYNGWKYSWYMDGNIKRYSSYCVHLKPENNWTATVQGLLKYPIRTEDRIQDKTGDPIEYKISEYLPSASTIQQDGDIEYGTMPDNTTQTAKVTNKKKEYPNTSIKVQKIWNDLENKYETRPDSLTVKLMWSESAAYNGEWKDVEGFTLTLTEANDWAGEFTEVPTLIDGKEVKRYVIVESTPLNYKYPDSPDVQQSNYIKVTDEIKLGELKNNLPKGNIKLNIFKGWEGDKEDERPTSIELIIIDQNGKEYGDPITITTEDRLDPDKGYWYVNTDDLDIVLSDVDADGNRIIYSVKEVGIDGYSSIVSETTVEEPERYGKYVQNTTMTNKRVETVEVEVVKKWYDDNNNKDNTRPTSITVKLLADGKVIQTARVTAKDGWKYTFEKLPEYKGDKKIIYTIDEVDVSGYTKIVNGHTIINRLIPDEGGSGGGYEPPKTGVDK